MSNGTVKWFNSNKGFGFIEGENGEDIFVLFSSIVGGNCESLRDGDKVIYETEQGDRQLRAKVYSLYDCYMPAVLHIETKKSSAITCTTADSR